MIHVSVYHVAQASWHHHVAAAEPDPGKHGQALNWYTQHGFGKHYIIVESCMPVCCCIGGEFTNSPQSACQCDQARSDSGGPSKHACAALFLALHTSIRMYVPIFRLVYIYFLSELNFRLNSQLFAEVAQRSTFQIFPPALHMHSLHLPLAGDPQYPR